MMRLALAPILVLLAACDTAELADRALSRTAETVVRPVIDDTLTGGQADAATRCIVDNATSEDLRLLVRDFGVVAGPSTVANVMAIAARPEVLACLADAGLSPLTGG